jgi:hypothetical protein
VKKYNHRKERREKENVTCGVTSGGVDEGRDDREYGMREHTLQHTTLHPLSHVKAPY